MTVKIVLSPSFCGLSYSPSKDGRGGGAGGRAAVSRHSEFAIRNSNLRNSAFRHLSTPTGCSGFVHPFTSAVASYSTPYRPSALILITIQVWLGRGTEYGLDALTPALLSRSKSIQPATLAPTRGGKSADVVDAAAATGNACAPEPTVGFSYSS